MVRKNRLHEIIIGWGFESFQPTEELKTTLGITSHRLMKIIRNDGKQELTVSEKEKIEKWLSGITNKPISEIKLMVDEGPSALVANNQSTATV